MRRPDFIQVNSNLTVEVIFDVQHRSFCQLNCDSGTCLFSITRDADAASAAIADRKTPFTLEESKIE